MISYSKQYALLIEKKMITENLQASTSKKLLKKKFNWKSWYIFYVPSQLKGTDYTVKLIYVAVIMMRVPELINLNFRGSLGNKRSGRCFAFCGPLRNPASFPWCIAGGFQIPRVIKSKLINTLLSTYQRELSLGLGVKTKTLSVTTKEQGIYPSLQSRWGLMRKWTWHAAGLTAR